MNQYEGSRSLAIAPNGEHFLLGAWGSLRLIDDQGEELWQQSVPDEAWGVNISGDGRLAVAAFGDGSIRWYRLSDGEPLLSLYITNDAKEWVLWSLSSYYDASPGDDRLIGWHVNNGKDKVADFYTAAQMRERFYRPQVISHILSELDEETALAKAGERAATSIAEGLPPTVELLSPVNGSSVPVTARLTWEGSKAALEAFVIKLRLYVLAIGVSDYEDDVLDLQFAAKDASDFADALKGQGELLYREVLVKLLTDASSDDLLDGLDWLRNEVTSKDVAMLFLAGHGVNDSDGDYYFLPRNANTGRLRRTAVAYFDIKKILSNLAGKTIAFIDTCHAGNIMGKRRGVADINAVINDLSAAENGVVVFASSSGKQYSLEDSKWGNGAFTKALVEGINGKADYTKDGTITINQLDLYLSERVKKLIGNQQIPTTTKPQTISDFPVVVVEP